MTSEKNITKKSNSQKNHTIHALGGNIGNIPNIPTFPHSPHSQDIKKYYDDDRYSSLNSKDKLLFKLCIKPMNITELANETSIHANNVLKHIDRSDRKKGLFYDELVTILKEENDVKTYVPTQKGWERVGTLIQQWIQQDENAQVLEYKRLSTQELIEDFKTYFEQQQILISDNNFITINFQDLQQQNLEIAEKLLDEPKDVIQAAEHALNYAYGGEFEGKKIRLTHLPKSTYIPVSAIRTKHINKLITTKGKIIYFSTALPLITTSRFECPSCGGILTHLQKKEKFEEPRICACGRKGNFRLLHNDMIDVQRIRLEESMDDLGRRSKMGEINVILKGDLTRIELQHFFEGSDEITINGIMIDDDMTLRRGGTSTTREIYIDANNLEVSEQEETPITKKEEQEVIEEIKKQGFRKKLIRSFAPQIINLEKEKLAVLLSIVSGGKKREKGDQRDDVHVLLIGDAGTGKSEIIKCVKDILPTVREASGEHSTGVGLTAAYEKNDSTFGGGAIIRKGTLPLAHGAGIVIDELDKMKEEETKYFHRALEQQDFTFSKGGITQKFLTDCFCIASANPKGVGRFDREQEFFSQMSFPTTIISRFDLIYAVLDEERTQEEEEIFALKILENQNQEPPFTEEFMRKYIYLARKTQPEIKQEQKIIISKEYALLKQQVKQNFHLTPRKLLDIGRIARSMAKMELRTIVTTEDVQQATNVIRESLQSLQAINIDQRVLDEKYSQGFMDKLQKVRSIFEEKAKEKIYIIETEEIKKEAKVDDIFITQATANGFLYEGKPGQLRINK